MKKCPLAMVSTANKSQTKFYIKLQIVTFRFQLDLLLFPLQALQETALSAAGISRNFRWSWLCLKRLSSNFQTRKKYPIFWKHQILSLLGQQLLPLLTAQQHRRWFALLCPFPLPKMKQLAKRLDWHPWDAGCFHPAWSWPGTATAVASFQSSPAWRHYTMATK